jgi:hypothetical protein
MEDRKSYQSAGVCSVNAKEGDRRLGVGAARCSGGCVASGRGDAGSNGGAGSTGSESSAESPVGEHGGRRGDGLRVVELWGVVGAAGREVEILPKLGKGSSLVRRRM